MKTAQPDKRLVVHFAVEVALGFLYQTVDLLQTLEVPHGRGKEKTENHVHIVYESLATLLLVAHEVYHHVGLVIANGDSHVALVDNAKRHGGVRRTRADFLDVGDAENDEHPTVVVLIAGTLVGIADVGKEIIGNVELVFQHLLVFFSWTGYLYPAVGLPFVDGCQVVVDVPECFHCSC